MSSTRLWPVRGLLLSGMSSLLAHMSMKSARAAEARASAHRDALNIRKIMRTLPLQIGIIESAGRAAQPFEVGLVAGLDGDGEDLGDLVRVQFQDAGLEALDGLGAGLE